MSISIAGLPPLAWTGSHGQAEYDAPSGELTLRARAGVDWTNDATGGPAQHEATALAFDAPAGDFVLSARVRVRGERGTFDAGALAVWSDSAHWAKLCNEYSPQGEAMVVSVVTNEFSDDANGPLLDADAVFLRVARVGEAFAFHFSRDSLAWHFVRVFRLGTPAPLAVGFLAQAPLGDGATAVFDRISFATTTLSDLRDLS